MGRHSGRGGAGTSAHAAPKFRKSSRGISTGVGRQRLCVRRLKRLKRDPARALAQLAEIEAGLSRSEAEKTQLHAQLDALLQEVKKADGDDHIHV